MCLLRAGKNFCMLVSTLRPGGLYVILRSCTQGNQVLEGSYGERVASSPFSLSAPSFLPFYSSNADMAVSVNVLDYYGQTASGA